MIISCREVNFGQDMNQKTSRSGKMLYFDSEGNETTREKFMEKRMQEVRVPKGRILGYNVLIQPDEKEVMSRGGILIPDGAKRKVMTGVVVAVGPGKIEKDNLVHVVGIQVGDKVAFRRNIPIEELEIEGILYYLINADGVVYKFSE